MYENVAAGTVRLGHEPAGPEDRAGSQSRAFPETNHIADEMLQENLDSPRSLQRSARLIAEVSGELRASQQRKEGHGIARSGKANS